MLQTIYEIYEVPSVLSFCMCALKGNDEFSAVDSCLILKQVPPSSKTYVFVVCP